MNEKAIEEVHVTHSMGGIMEFERTGIYPNTLKIKSSTFKQTWRVKVKEDRQSGVLKIKGAVVYQYSFDEKGFSIQEVVNGIVMQDCLTVIMTVEMND
jgi:hypothetical protein